MRPRDYTIFLVLFVLIAGMAGCTGRSSKPEPPAARNVVPAGLTCGSSDDGLAHIPPDFNTFTPPLRGRAYVDPQYGCTVARLTDARQQFNQAVHHQYSSISAVNQDDSRIMLLTEAGQGLITDMTGNVIVGPNAFPAINTGNVPWSRAVADAFYYTSGNTLHKGVITGHAVTSSAIQTFGGNSTIVIPDQEDLSEDGDHLWLVAGNTAFLYTISDGTAGASVNVGAKDAECGWHKLQIMPSNRLLITWSCNGPGAGRGQEIYNPDGSLFWHMFDNSIHTDVGRDLKGNEIAIVDRIPDTYKDACPSGGGADVIRVDPPHAITCLVDIRWASAHISYRDSAQGWVVISFFDPGACPDYSCFAPLRLLPDWYLQWKHFYEEVILIKVDGSAVVRLAHHRSRSAESYWAESRATISRDGHYVVFDSNMDISFTGLNNYSDVYLIKVQ